MATLVLLRILVVVLLVALNAFFVAAEFAIVSVRDTRVQQLIDGHRTGARTVQRLQQHLDDFLPAVQFGVTLASLALGWIGEPANMTVREILVPRQNIFSVPADMALEDAMARVVEEQHSRIPVYDPKLGKEHIVGVLYSKDLARFMHMRLSSRSRTLPPEMTLRVRHIMRDILVVPETKPVIDLLSEFRERKRHLATVVEELGSAV